MKTAEEWTNKWWTIKFAADAGEKEGMQTFTELVKQIQLDAWKQGMTDAAKLESGVCPMYSFIPNIISNRDNKTTT